MDKNINCKLKMINKKLTKLKKYETKQIVAKCLSLKKIYS